MRGFGFVVLVVGIIALLAAMNMDVSVASGAGRVNNLGLMSERQNFTMIAGLAVIAGLMMVIFGSKKPAAIIAHAADSGYDTRACPLCAETIKRAAIKCKHCGADVGQAQVTPVKPSLRFGWVARVICSDQEERDRVTAAIQEAGFPVVEMHKVGGLAAGAYEKKPQAEEVAAYLEEHLGYAVTVMFRDKVSGDYS
ncbi:hypothetical protein AABC73_20500 [Pseudomonas sp. G.S.17]|uniref:hypothetical protein n=1 Tax=Pseudomonas sp. G.S.17 TaxID=3137451 RepID=UPI00311CDF60